MQLFFRALVVVAVATSGVVVGWYAYSVGLASGADHAAAMGAVAIALVVFEAALLPLASRSKSRLGFGLCLATLAVVAPAVLTFDLGFAASVASDARAVREAQQGPPLAKGARLAAVVAIDLEGQRRAFPGLSVDWCRSSRASRAEPCDRWEGLRKELAEAQAWEARGAAPVVGDADARGALIARITGLPLASVGDVLTLLTALAFSLVRIVGGHLAFGSPAPTPAEPPPISQNRGPDGRKGQAPAVGAAAVRLVSAAAVAEHLSALAPDGQWVSVTTREIGTALGANPGTVSRLLKRAASDELIELDVSGSGTRVRTRKAKTA